MLVAPMVSLHKVPDRKRRAPASLHASRTRFEHARVPTAFTRHAGLTTWLVCGLVALLCIPPTRGSAMLGATLPFWLIGAPLLNLAWLERDALVRVLRRRVQDFRMRRRGPSALHARSSDTMCRGMRQRA